MANRQYPRGLASTALWQLCLISAIAMVVLPLYLLFKYSISDVASINTGGAPIPLWPLHPTFSMFIYLFRDAYFFSVILNSLVIAIFVVIGSLILGVPAAFVLGRYRVPGRRMLILGLISVRLFPDISSVIPVTEFFIRVGLHSSYIGVILAHILLALPYVIFITMGSFESIPRDLEEQAMVMGANGFQRFFQVLLPLAVPGLVASAIYTFLLSWDEFIFSYFILGLGKISTLTLFLNQKLAFSPPQNLLAAISVCLSLPVIIFSMMVQRYNTSGITAGGIK